MNENMKFKGGPKDKVYKRKILGHIKKDSDKMQMKMQPTRKKSSSYNLIRAKKSKSFTKLLATQSEQRSQSLSTNN